MSCHVVCLIFLAFRKQRMVILPHWYLNRISRRHVVLKTAFEKYIWWKAAFLLSFSCSLQFPSCLVWDTVVSHLNVEQSDQKVSNPCQIVSYWGSQPLRLGTNWQGVAMDTLRVSLMATRWQHKPSKHWVGRGTFELSQFGFIQVRYYTPNHTLFCIICVIVLYM